MRQLKNLLSLANVMKRRTRPRGQIATYLLLMVGALLIVALATANLGRLSLTTLKASNAADSGALLLGSQLATKANMQWKTLGQKIEKCQSSGMLATVLAIIAAIVVVVVTWGAAAPLVIIALAALAGATAGAAGGAISGTGALSGAIQGAIVGAAIGAAGAAAPAAGAAGPGGATFTVASEIGAETVAVGAFGTIPAGLAGAAPATGSVIAGSTIAGAGIAVSTAGSLYGGSVREQMRSDSFTVAARALNGLPTERDSVRETVFLQTLGQTVDDPNKTDNPTTTQVEGACYWPTPGDPIGKAVISGDPNDTDADGDVNESIPCFEYWWDRRTDKLKNLSPQLRADIQAFFDGPMSTFETQAEAAYGGGGSSCGDRVCEEDEQCGWANECPVDCGACPGEGGGSESDE